MSSLSYLFLLIFLKEIYGQGQVLTPPYFNLALERRISATATCGELVDGPELFCKLVGANNEADINNLPADSNSYELIQGQICDHCDPSIEDKRHPANFAVDGRETWWQSPPLSRGMKYNEVNLTIDLGQEFHVAYVYIKMGNSPRPAVWALEKSADNGKTYQPWQYFSDTNADCENYFGPETLKPITRDDSVICITQYSKVVPLEGGEIFVSLLQDRPSSKDFFNSTVLQEWTRATNVRLRLLKVKNLLGHLMSVARQDPTTTRRYYYSIKDIGIGGRCRCNGHADTCDIADPDDSYKWICRCQHNTCGHNCELCCPGFEQKAWSQSRSNKQFVCEPCNCHGHSNKCVYDPEIDNKRLSLDIHGNYEGGGVCKDCRDNTEGINCNKCTAGYYRPYNKQFNETDVCQPCECNHFYATGNCEEGSGKCECKDAYTKPNCDSCAFGYFGYPECEKCKCHVNGTLDFHCAPTDGTQCPCKENFAGDYCDICGNGYYNFPDCSPCECNPIGSLSDLCEPSSGNCSCSSNFAGRTCLMCADGYYNFPQCTYCNCDIRGTESGICDKGNGTCLCREGYTGQRCDQCKAGYYGYPDCKLCGCSSVGSASSACDATGKCPCLVNFAGKTCSQCSPGFYQYPTCLACNCDGHGSIGVSCDNEGKCQCKKNFAGARCEQCKEGLYNFPYCEECNCNPAGVLKTFAGCGSLPAGELCQCKARVQGRICNECRSLFWNLQPNNPDGCEDCDCFAPGTIGSIKDCDPKTGQCVCKSSTNNRRCDTCADGSFDLQDSNLFGCTECSCDIGGASNNVCDKFSGQCMCQARITGRTCNEPLQAHYYPSLHHYQYEIEDGHTPSFTQVRFGFYNKTFPNYSWRGYAVFSPLQNEIVQEVNIEKPSVYRMLLRYINPNKETVIGKIKIVPDNPSEDDDDQNFQVQLKHSLTPQFVTVSGATGSIPSPFVLDPGRYSVIIAIKNNINPAAFVDYFVLLPAAFYEADILAERILHPCTLKDQKLCRHFNYPNISQYDSVFSNGAYTSQDDSASREPPKLFFNNAEDLKTLNVEELPLLNQEQPKLHFDLRISKPGPHVLVLTYVSPKEIIDPAEINIEASSQNKMEKGTIKLYSCIYTWPCRTTVTDRSGKVSTFNFDTNYISVHLDADQNNSNASIGIQSIVAIPLEKWSINHVQPKTECVRKDGVCIQAKFPTPPESKKIEVESGLGQQAVQLPNTILDNKTGLVYLDHKDAMVDVSGKVNSPGGYVFVVHFYQPHFPEFDMDVLIQNGQFYEAKLPVKHCPANSGCRAVVQQNDGNNVFQLTENFVATFKEPNHKSVWLDYILLIPEREYNEKIINEEPFDQTGEFIAQCGQNNFYMDNSTSNFCKKSTFSLTTSFLSGALPCSCDIDGSLSFECEKFGGQCQCRPNVIGRRCEMCKTGYFGFPYCKVCDCPATALCDSYTGACICPPRVTGEKCDQCEVYTYGFDPIIGCDECNCHSHGVVNGSLQCDLFNGSCSCKPNVVGRTCDHCVEGHWSFPYCIQCECDRRGTTSTICDQTTAECYCKKNVFGQACDICKEGTYNIQPNNPDGCTRCFCFGKTTKCSSSNLYRSKITSMNDWKMVGLSITKTVSLQHLDLVPDVVDKNQVGIDITINNLPDKLLYFSAPKPYLDNKLVSYGGYFNYSIFYTTGPFGDLISGVDIVFHGSDNIYLLYHSQEVPSSDEIFEFSFQIIESNFVLPSGLSATREMLMQVLEKLKGIYVRSAYYESTIVSRLGNVSLDAATNDFSQDSETALSVEQCECPPNYTGLSCEECADGYYRTSSGPYGGFCAPCQCNGHSKTCDKVTGLCLDCKHETEGDHCEKCISGYHGDATHGTPGDCLICACPLPVPGNNFATSCDMSHDGTRVSCQCVEGYMGPRCESCSAGFFGRPEFIGDYCKPCECSGNINQTDPGSCDSVSGECTGCLFNSAGESCQYCAPGYFGDAVSMKNCQSCACSQCGTKRCDHETGICECKNKVIGDKCESCESEHYGFQTCQGCRPCQCSIASESLQCDDATGQCRCKPGVTGRTCDRCLPGYWNYTENGCVSCGCNSNLSIGVGCSVITGQCECLPGVIGEKCDKCPRRWTFIPDVGCKGCDYCTDGLLDTIDGMENELQPVTKEFQTVAVSFFTTQRLHHINETALLLNPNVSYIDQNRIDFKPTLTECENLEQEIRNFNRKAMHNKDTAEELGPSAGKLLIDTIDEVKNVEGIINKVDETVKQVVDLSNHLDQGTGTEIENAFKEGQTIIDAMYDNNVDEEKETEAKDGLIRAEEIFNKMNEITVPVYNTTNELNELRNKLKTYQERLDDANSKTKSIGDNFRDIVTLNMKNKNSQISAKASMLNNLTKDANDSLDDAKETIKNATLLVDESKILLGKLGDRFVDMKKKVGSVNETLYGTTDIMQNAAESVAEAKKHAKDLVDQAKKLDSSLSNSRSLSQNALSAANAYKNIAEIIDEAKDIATNASDSADNATDMSKGLSEKNAESQTRSSELLNTAKMSLDDVQGQLVPELDIARMSVGGVGSVNKQASGDLEAIVKALDILIPKKIDIPNTDKAQNSETTALDTIANIDDIVKGLPEKLNKTDQLSNDLVVTNNKKELIDDTLNSIGKQLPEINVQADKLKSRPEDLAKLGENVKNGLDELKKKITQARDIANRIPVGTTLTRSSILELKNPENIAELAQRSVVSLYFKTREPNGLLYYLGNGEGTSRVLRRTNTDDFMALQIENGYPILTLDLGSGPSQIIMNNKFVADDRWYQAIVDRTGKTVNFKIIEDLGRDRYPPTEVFEKEAVVNGSSSLLNLDKDHSKLFIGGVPNTFDGLQPAVKYSSFDGKIEELMVGEVPVGLWNFAQSSNVLGAKERDQLLISQASQTGFRFNGDGYIVLDSSDYQFNPDSNEITIVFKTTAKDGLLFLVHGSPTFLSIELREGHILYQYNLGEGLFHKISPNTFNDGVWHIVDARRSGKKGVLLIDQVDIGGAEEASGDITELNISENVYIGGHPGTHNLPEVTNANFDGCIETVVISSANVDLNKNKDSLGIIPGCKDKISSVVSFEDGVRGYVRYPNAAVTDNEMYLLVRFKTLQPNGLIAYAEDGSATVTLWLKSGALILQSGNQEVSSSSSTNYADGQWHSVMAIHDSSALKLNIDDYDMVKSQVPPNPIRFLSGNLYFGGVPSSVNAEAAFDEHFVGCLSDATLNGVVINFANCTEAPYVIMGKCLDPSKTSIGGVKPNRKVQPPIKEDDGSGEDDEKKEVVISSTEAPATTTTPSPIPIGQCVLPLYPAADVDLTPNSGYRFGTSKISRMEYQTITGRSKSSKNYNFTIEVKTTFEQDGIIFYAADSKHISFIAIYIKDNRINYSFNFGTGAAHVTSDNIITNGEWHTIDFIRNLTYGKLRINGQPVGESESKGKANTITGPFYLGATPLKIAYEVKANVGLNNTFIGCLRNLKTNARLVQDSFNQTGVVPCSDHTERGVFFYNTGGYVKAIDNFRVGKDMDLQLDIKPRNISGLLVSIHGKRDYFIMQMIDGAINVTADNGRGPITAIFTPPNPYYFCDGKWHTLSAIKTKNVVTLIIDGSPLTKLGLGPSGSSDTDTNNAVFIGGHPFQINYSKRLRGLVTNVQYTGCIKNVVINGNNKLANLNQAYGNVSLNICPTI